MVRNANICGGRHLLRATFLILKPSEQYSARGKKAYDHVGNRQFRALVKQHQANYSAAVCKHQKSKIVDFVLNAIRSLSPQGGFVKSSKGVWYEVGDRTAKEKIGQT